jgi:hypothetical protein
MISPFGVDHGSISKAEGRPERKKQAAAAGTAAGVGAAGYGATRVHMPEHSHYSKETRAALHKLPPGVHEVDTKMLAKRPRKLGARRQQTPYVATMAKERPVESFKSSPVPVTRYKGGHVIQRDSAHSVMANAMKDRKTTIKIEDAPGHRPTRPAGEELVRRGQMRYQQRRLKRNFNIGEKGIERKAAKYKASSRKFNTAKRPHGVTEETFSYNPKKLKAKAALGIKRAKNVAMVVKRDDRNRNVAAGATGAAGVGTLAATPVRRSAIKANVSGGTMSAKDARKVVSPGYRPGNKKAIKTMAANMGHLENTKTTVIRYKDDRVLPFDGNHRASARLARGDKKIPVKVVQGGERPAVSVARNVYHTAQQRIHRSRLDRDVFKPNTKAGTKGYTGRHTGQTKTYGSIANASPSRSGKRVAIASTRSGSGPTRAMLRTRQGATVAAGSALLGTAGYLSRKKRS